MRADVVSAYKSQVKENESLQATIKSLRAAAARRAAASLPRTSQSEEDSGAESTKEDEVTSLWHALVYHMRVSITYMAI